MAAVEGAHMMMQCPRCSTRWRVAAASPMENPLFKCGRCHHLFRQFPGAPAPTEPATASGRRAAAVPEPDTLEFIFPERQPAAIVVPERALEEVTQVVDADGDALAAADGGTELVAATPVSAAPPVVVTPLAELHEAETAAFDLPREEPIDAHDAADDDLADDVLAEPNDDDAILEDDDPPILGAADEEDDEAVEPVAAPRRTVRVEEIMKTPAGFGTIVRGIGTAVAGFAALALVVRSSPERAAGWLSHLPLAGRQFATDRNLTSKIELRNVQGKYQRLRNARRVFVISGDARNNSPVTVDRIEVAGALYGLGGGELDQKVVTTGNRTTLTDLSEAEIVLLQRLDPAIALAPGPTTPFLIVFLEPPRELREFSSRVLSVRPTRRASSPPDSRRDSVG